MLERGSAVPGKGTNTNSSNPEHNSNTRKENFAASNPAEPGRGSPSQGAVFQTAMISSDPNPIFLFMCSASNTLQSPSLGCGGTALCDGPRCVHQSLPCSRVLFRAQGRGFGNSAWMPRQRSALGGRSAFQGTAKASSLHSQHVLPGRRCHAIGQPCSFCGDSLVFKENSLRQAHRAGKSSSF